MSKWQPISTAPRDGTDILGCYAWTMADGVYRIGWIADGYLDGHFDGGRWVFASLGIDPEEYSAPTHWMRLPDPPKQDNGP
jgi:hypothetical protein